MDFSSLRYFKAVAETQNMSKAAKNQFVSQSALSKNIKSLEDELGGPLFYRTGKSLVLNDGGRILLRFANEVLNQYSLMQAELSDYFGRESTTVSLSINIGTNLLMMVLPEFLEKHPQIHLQITQNDFSMPDHDNYDICINSSVEEMALPNTVTLFREELLLALPHNHPLAKAPEIYMKDIAKENFIQLRGRQLTDITRANCQLAGFEPNIVLYTDFPGTTLDLIELGLGITFMPEITWCNISRGGIIQRRVEDAKMYRYISLSWRQNGYFSIGANLLKDHLLRFFESNPFNSKDIKPNG